MRPGIRAIYTDWDLSKMSEYELSRNVCLAVHLCWKEIFLWNRRLACTCFNLMLPYLIWKFWIWDHGEGRCAAQNSSRMQFYDPRWRMKLNSETGRQGLCKPRCATERVIASETSIISRSLRLNLLLFSNHHGWSVGISARNTRHCAGIDYS